MDYILFGAGTGASLAVIGWILREWGPRFRDGKADDGIIHSASELIDRMSWARFCASCGMALVMGGTLILIVTAIVAGWNPGDVLASRILLGTYGFVSLLMLAWSFLYTRQFGTSGIYRPVAIEPVSDTREAVAVSVTDTSTRPAEEPAPQGESDTEETDADTTTESMQDIEQVAASRGGLGRFASFFNRNRPAETTEELVVEETDDETVVEAIDETDAERQGGVVVQNVAAVTTTEAGETIAAEEWEIDENEPLQEGEAELAQAAPREPIEAETMLSGESVLSEAPGDPPAGEATGEPAPPVSPEDDALAQLRRRRLARLSGSDQ